MAEGVGSHELEAMTEAPGKLNGQTVINRVADGLEGGDVAGETCSGVCRHEAGLRIDLRQRHWYCVESSLAGLLKVSRQEETWSYLVLPIKPLLHRKVVAVGPQITDFYSVSLS